MESDFDVTHHKSWILGVATTELRGQFFFCFLCDWHGIARVELSAFPFSREASWRVQDTSLKNSLESSCVVNKWRSKNQSAKPWILLKVQLSVFWSPLCLICFLTQFPRERESHIMCVCVPLIFRRLGCPMCCRRPEPSCVGPLQPTCVVLRRDLLKIQPFGFNKHTTD